MKTDRYVDENARRFDPQWETTLPSLREYLTKLATDLQEAEIADPEAKRTRRRREAAFHKFREAHGAGL